MGEAVWAKIKYNPYWPGRLVNTPPHIKQPPRKFCVFFFGTNNFGFVDLENTHSYWEYKQKYIKKGRGKMFLEAVEQCEKFINDPSTSNLPDDTIKIVKEFEFAIKKEPDENQMWYTNDIIESCAGCKEKDARLKAAEKDKENFEADRQKLEKEIDRLNKECDIKTAQLECYRNSEFEVESIHAHKVVRGKEMFLIRWKYFDFTEDCWVKKEDLNCPLILKQYLKANNLN